MTRLPPFPWDRLAPYTEQAAAHPEAIDLIVKSRIRSLQWKRW